MSDTSHAAPAVTDVTQYVIDQFARLTPEEQSLVIAYAELLRDRRTAQHPASHLR